jgi:hypothetical protein
MGEQYERVEIFELSARKGLAEFRNTTSTPLAARNGARSKSG